SSRQIRSSWGLWGHCLPALPCQSWLGVLDDLEAKVLDHWIRKDVPRNALHFGLCGSAIHIIEIQHKEFALANVAHSGVAERRERLLNGGALRIEDRGFEHYPNVGFHAGIIAG